MLSPVESCKEFNFYSKLSFVMLPVEGSENSLVDKCGKPENW